MVLVRGTEAVGSETSYSGPRGSPVSQHGNGVGAGQDRGGHHGSLVWIMGRRADVSVAGLPGVM